MNHALKIFAIIACSLCCSPASAGNPRGQPVTGVVPDCIGKWCRDDYCRKDAPCVGVPLCFGCDDYCPKKAPCVCVPLGFCCDDYCKKCPPAVCRQPLCEYLKCGPPPCGVWQGKGRSATDFKTLVPAQRRPAIGQAFKPGGAK